MNDLAWSRHCGDLWREHVLAATGFDIQIVIGALPRSAGQWAAMMRRLAVRDMAGVLSSVHGKPIPYRRANRGDIVRRGWAIGICRGPAAEFFGGTFEAMREIDSVWSLKAGLDAITNAVVPSFSSNADVDPRTLLSVNDSR